MAVHGVPRATGDLDLWIDALEENAHRVWAALLQFGAPVEILGVTIQDLTSPGMVVQIGLPPRRIDVMTSVTGLTFEDAWMTRVTHEVEQLEVPFVGRNELIANKRATGRPKDLADIHALGESKGS